MADPVLESARALVARTGMLPPGCAVLVAVSGGQDSCALLHVLMRLQDELRLTLHAAHLHHGIRGPDADADAAHVGALCAGLGVPCAVGHQDVPEQARRMHLSVEHAARVARHRFLECEAARIGASRIALGHTRDDRIETVLLNVLRGTGVDGLVGMRPVSGPRVRPLLEVTRAETAAYCDAHAVAFREDASNLSLEHTRCRARAELLPMLAAYYNPAVRDALLRLADLAAEDADYLGEQAERAFRDAAREQTGGSVVLSTRDVAGMPPAVARRVVRAAIEQVRGSLVDVEYRDVARILEAVTRAQRAGEAGHVGLRDSLFARVDPESLTVFRRVAASARRLRYDLPTPGAVEAAELGIRVTAAWAPRPAQTPPNAGLVAALAAERVRPPLVVRTRLPGDRLQPLGMQGTRKLQDYLVDRKVPAPSRDRLALVADQDGILWVVGHTVSERGRLGPDTRDVLRLEAAPLT